MAEELNLSDRTLDRLAERLGRVQGNSGARSASMGSGGSSSENKGPSAIGLATEALTAKFNPLGDATDAVKKAYGNLESVITPGLNTWRDLSKTGINFGNDIVGMSAAAAGTRMTLAEFGDVIKSNAGNFTGLGGNAAKGAENFAKLSKEMADSGFTDDLRMLGMTSKDINEVLAIQLANQQTINMGDAQAKAKAIASATALAFEMDQMSKLTGKSRAEQEEIMKKAQADMQAEAKLRILTMGKSEEEAAAIRDNYYKQQKEAELRGQGQMFKEVFATGTIQSEAAASQVAISGKEAEATMKAARATAAGDAQAATEFQKEARLENSKNMRDVNKLQLATIGDQTAAGKAQMESMTANNAYYRAEQAVSLQIEREIREGKRANLTADEKAKLIQEETIKQAKAAQTEKKPGSESTEAIVKLGARADDAASAVMNGLVVPMNKDVGPALKKFNEGLLSNQMTDKTGKTNTKVQAAETELTEGYARGKAGKTVEGVKTLSDAAKKNQPGSMLENFAGGAGEAIGLGMGSVLVPALDKIADKINPTKRAEGAVINNPELAIIGEAGKEYVVPEDKMQTLMQNVKLDGLQSAAKALGGGDKAGGDKAGGGINLSSLSKEISTSISSVTGGGSTSTNRVQNADSKKAQEELVALEEKQVAERKKAVDQLKEEGVIKGKFASSSDYKNIPQLAALKEKQAGEKAELSKRVDAGTSFETVREEAKAETTKIVNEQIAITKNSNSTLADMYRDNSKDKLDIAKKDTESLDNMYKDDSKVNLDLAKQRNEALFKAADLAKDVIGTSVKDMSDSMIESMIPKGTKIEDYYIDMNDKLQSNAVDTVARMEQIAKESANATITEEQAIVETKIAINKTVTALTKEQLEIRSAAEQQIAELRNNGVNIETESAKAIQIIKSDALNDEIAKITGAAKAVEEQVTKKAEAVVKPKQNPADMFGGMFEDMFGDMLGGKGKELPPFMQKLNAQIKDIKPAEIKTPQTANKEGTKPTAANTTKPAEPKTETKKPEEKKEAKPAGTVEQVGLKDLHTSLEHLNKSMAQLLSYSQQTATAAQAQVKATKGLSSNKFN